MTDARQPISGAGEECPNFETLSCYADGELDGGRLSALASHVEACARCAALAARLRDGFEADDASLDGGIGGSGCASEEMLVLYAGGGMRGSERLGLDAHLAGCDACVRAVTLLHRRLGVASSVAAPVPMMVQRRADVVLEAALRDLAPGRAVAPVPRPRLFDRLSHLLRVPVLVPVAAAAALLLAVNVVPRDSAPVGERSRAIAPSSVSMRVKAVEAPVYARPSMNSTVVATVQRGTRLEVAGEERDWYEVHLEGGASGWVAREAFE